MKRVRNGARKAAHRVSIPHRAVEATIDTLRIGQNGSLMITDRTVDFGSSRKRKKLDPPPALPSHPWSDPSSVDPTTSTSSPSHSPTPSLDCPLPVEQSFARSGIPSMPSPQTPAAKATVEPSKPTKIKKSLGHTLDEWEAQFDMLLNALLDMEAHAQIPGICQSCGKDPALYRCRECANSLGLCATCVKVAHVQTPLHWIEEWDADAAHFNRIDLSSIGHVWHLGHHGAPCPELSRLRAPEPREMTVTHTNGIHVCKIMMCRCPSYPPLVRQLLRCQLFPATLEHPQSVFTFAVMTDSHLDTLTSKKSAYDYMQKLRRQTNNAHAHAVKDRYREFMLAARIWRHLQMLKRSGWCHGVRYPNSPPDSIIFRCHLCPWDGVNLPSDWESTPEHLMFLYKPRLAADACHGLPKKAKMDDSTDRSLAGLRGCMNCIGKLPGYTETYPKEMGKIVQTCSGFKVTRSQKVSKFRFLHITGVCAVVCSRHGCFWPQAVVDLPGGEQFILIDLALSGALECLRTLQGWMLTYDVGCSYLKNILDRWDKGGLPKHLRPIVEKLQVLLPQLHMLAHKEWCQTEFAVCYTPGAGHTNGEAIEPLWASHNAAGPSTREMNGGARHDALNDLFCFWNWVKHENFAKHLARKLQEKLRLQLDQLIDFAALTLAAGPARVHTWVTRGLDPAAPTPVNCRAREKERPRDVYLLASDKVPSAGKAYDDLVKRFQDVLPISASPGAGLASGSAARLSPEQTLFLRKGVEIGLQQVVIRARIESFRRARQNKGTSLDTSRGLRSIRDTLRSRLTAWQQTHEEAMPELRAVLEQEEVDDADEEDDGDAADDDEGVDLDEDTTGLTPRGPEDQILFLPSDLDSSSFTAAHCELMGSFEFHLRQAHAYEFIAALKVSLNQKAATIESKIRNARGTKANIAAQEEVNRANQAVVHLAKQFNDNLTRMQHLSLLLQNTPHQCPVPSTLKSIDLTKDLAPANLHSARHLGDSAKTDSWIFAVPPPHADSSQGNEAWEEETIRVRWVRAWANFQRTNEEVSLLYAEARAAHLGFSFAAGLRRETANGKPQFASAGARAYGLEKAAMFTRMAEDVVERVTKTTVNHRKAMEEDDDRRVPYTLTQKHIIAHPDRLDYALTIRPLIMHASPKEAPASSIRKLRSTTKAVEEVPTWEQVLDVLEPVRTSM